ncbi:MFS general substrate transporter [Viridothelium virens]|uniref:MFS general substrate transporter n=1 Tax=Viridothelium virens TaxID=1048519 RepID=A0A6A6GSZ2_VIRVR|nr:MFS general substrate transporter [Viridothelium virens]
MWYRRSEQTNRNAAWYSMLGVVNMLGSLLSYGLAHIQSSVLRPYQIIFLFCGALTVVFSILIFLILPDSPIDAKFLKTDHDKLIAIERLRMNQMGISSRAWKWSHVREAFLDPKTYLWFSMITAIAIPSGGISTFGPLIVESFGFDSFTTILFNIPFGAVQFVATLGSAYLATVWKVKSVLLIMLCLPPIAGCVMLLAVEHDKAHRGVLLAGYYIISVYPAISPLIYSWSAQNTAGDTKRKVTTGILFVGQSVGNVVGPHLYQPSEAPRYTRGLTSNLALFVVLIALVCVGVFSVRILNLRHARRRAQMGKAEKVLDLSMEGQKEVRDKGQVLNESEAFVGDKAFDDITDLKNEDFIYIY